MTKDGRFGNKLGFGDMNGDGYTDIFVGATRKSIFSYLGGTVEILFSSSLK
jgi:FG-GAP repeat